MKKNSSKAENLSADDARERLIRAGIAIFAVYGYEGASTRMLASEAKVNLAAIPYYFGGKEGLYHAVIRSIVDFGRRKIFPKIMEVKEKLDSGNPSRKELVRMLEELMSNYVGLVTSDETPHVARIMFQEQLQPTKAFSIFYDDLLKEEHSVVTAIIARLLKIHPNSREAIVNAHALLGHVMIFLAGRALILRRLGQVKFTEADAELLQKTMKQHVRAIFR
ncbi:MAG: hypothetical protein A2X48_15770 [Lentisphaerae bacterium GWF2_49_21]|nr:MAG: hypothetical protein A2X48_15770 [Lentisphaerae bacterium GWF2_49_21]